ncbi:MAG TPA: hypothetical protein VFD41_12865, partial [Actinomycetales bacterium]|nr:hypothetical protein [Actinomycetales bacterium]
VETVYLGTFRREVLEKLGGFDETFARAQDWELNHRIRQGGGTVWFTPRLRVIYRPRSTARALARQFFTTGTWRQQVVRRYPGTANARYLAPPVVVLVIVVASAGAGAGLAAGVPGAAAGLLAPLAYLGGVGVVTASAAGQLDRAAVRRLPLVIVTMHLCWGSGFLWGLLSSLGRRSRR